MNYTIYPEATMAAYGDMTTNKRGYQPLDMVQVRITGRDKNDKKCHIRVCDAKFQQYYEISIKLKDNQGEATFTAAGNLGVHWIYLYFAGNERHSRYLNFLVDCETGVETGEEAYDTLYPITKEALLLGRRDFQIPSGPFAGYISGDTWRIDGVWLRDWIYQLDAYKYWEKEMSGGLSRFLEVQQSDGSVPDGIRRDGTTWRATIESDVEYILLLGVWKTWLVTGDDTWLSKLLPSMEKALGYVQNDKRRWNNKHQLVKRGHTCDTWDFDSDGIVDYDGGRSVIATCDQSGYYLAFSIMAQIYRHFGCREKSRFFASRARSYRKRANYLLWDGIKYLHHIHLSPIQHPGFDETRQLAMGNVWAITRGLANHNKAVSIIQEYRNRQKETGDAFPWWSLQPGYPDNSKHFRPPYARQGGYANGGLMPWVGGELCLASLEHGMEKYGVELYRQYFNHLKHTENRVHVWYWPDGQPGFRTTNEVPYTGWGMAQWLKALIEGLAGIKDTSGQMKKMEISPRWAATGQKEARAVSRYAINDSYFTYHMKIDLERRKIMIRYSGSGNKAQFRVLLPADWDAQTVLTGKVKIKFEREKIGDGVYTTFSTLIKKPGEIEIRC